MNPQILESLEALIQSAVDAGFDHVTHADGSESLTRRNDSGAMVGVVIVYETDEEGTPTNVELFNRRHQVKHRKPLTLAKAEQILLGVEPVEEASETPETPETPEASPENTEA